MHQPNLPKHVAIIMDGNGRWAEAQGLDRTEGHRKGAERVRDVVRHCREAGIRALTLYAFSEQNWGRPSAEVDAIMHLLGEFVQREREEILAQEIKLVTIGERERIPEHARKPLESVIRESEKNDKMILCLALSYGAREELAGAAKELASRVKSGEINAEDICAESIEEHLDTHIIPWELDLIIRTSGEYRLSNFLLWQAAYAEFFFTEVLWPDFDESHLKNALDTFASRKRRYGLVPSGEKERAC